MRKQIRVRNGRAAGERKPYSASGIKYILTTCRSAFNWAARRRYLPPYTENPFSSFGIDNFDRREHSETLILTPEQQRAFFDACDEWQRSIFLVLAMYGVRDGELTYLLMSDADLGEGVFEIQSKPEMFWRVKTCDERTLPLLPEVRAILERHMNGRIAGFVFLNREFWEGSRTPSETFSSAREMTLYLQRLVDEAREQGAQSEKQLSRAIQPFLRAMGQIPVKRVRQEFMKLTTKIGCPELTRAHSLRHLFPTRAQEVGCCGRSSVILARDAC